MKKFLFMPMLVNPGALSDADRKAAAESDRPPITMLAVALEPAEVQRLIAATAQARSAGFSAASVSVNASETLFLSGDDPKLDLMAEEIAQRHLERGLSGATPAWVDDEDLPGKRDPIAQSQHPLGVLFTYLLSDDRAVFTLNSPVSGEVANGTGFPVEDTLLGDNAPEQLLIEEPLKVLAASVGSNMLREGSGGDGNFDISGAIDITDEGDFWVHGRVFVDRSLVDENIDQLKEKANAGG